MLYLFCVLLLLLSFLFTLIQYSFKQNTDRQVLYVEQNALSGILQSVDQEINTAKYQSILLSKNPLITTALNAPLNSTPLLYNQSNRVCEHLKTLSDNSPSIDSIYLYSKEYEYVITEDGYTPIDTFKDIDWLENLNIDSQYCYSRAIDNLYPYVYSVITPLSSTNCKSYIIFNINFENITILKKLKMQKSQKIYICSGANVIFSFNQESPSKPISDLPELKNAFDYKNNIIKKTAGVHTAYTRLFSDTTNLDYVIITPLPEYGHDVAKLVLHVLLLLVVILIVSFIIAFYFTTRNYEPIQSIHSLLNQQASTDYYNSMLVQKDDIADITEKIMILLSKNKELSSTVQDQLNTLRQTELMALQSQFNPHFLFNTLNLIYSMEIETLGYEHPSPKITQELCKILRYSMDSSSMVLLSKDLFFLDLYIDILKKRYPDTLCINIHTDDSLLNCSVPSLLIQPMLENCMVHGYSHSKNIFRIDISITKDKYNKIKFTVEDNGIAIATAVIDDLIELKNSKNIPVSGKKTGLYYIVLKLKNLYREHFTLDIKNNNSGGNTITITIPKVD